MTGQVEVHIRVPKVLHQQLRAAAEENRRSLGAEIVVRLLASVKKP